MIRIIKFFKRLFTPDTTTKKTPDTKDSTPGAVASSAGEPSSSERQTTRGEPDITPPSEFTKNNSQKPALTPKKKKWSISNFQVEPKEGETRFHDLDLPLSVMHAISDLRFEYCTPIQAQLLTHTLKGKDATAKAQTGTGKSASFIITILASFIRKSFKNKKGTPRALILAPTRELVHQIEKDFKGLAKYTPLRIVAIYGGTGYLQQQKLLKDRPVDVIVATPGRLIDFMGKRLINPSRVEIMILDEADRMLDMGFIPDVRKIIYKTPHKEKRQTLFFSATLTDEVLRLAESWTTKDAVRIEIDPDHAAADSIKQIVYITTEDDKFKNVYNLINHENLQRVIIFVNRKDTAKMLSSKFQRYGQNCGVLSGDVSQDKRFKVLERFKNGNINLLVATDVAARGLHIDNISHVVNYDLPHEPEHYIHRIGRTGRAGSTGTSISFADEMSSFFIPQIEEVLGNKIECEYPSEALDKPLPKPSPVKHSPRKTTKRKPYKGKYNPSKTGYQKGKSKKNKASSNSKASG